MHYMTDRDRMLARLAEHQPCTSRQIAEETGISRRTITSALSDMARLGLVLRAGTVPAAKGNGARQEAILWRLTGKARPPARRADGPSVPLVAPMPAAPSAPPQVRVTQCPGYTGDRRYAVDNASGEFSRVGIGHYVGAAASCAAKAIA